MRKANLNLEIAHTVVDMLAYFSVRDFLARPVNPSSEKKGIKPNPNYYPAVKELYPMFELYAENPSIYMDFEDLVKDMIVNVSKASPMIENH